MNDKIDLNVEVFGASDIGNIRQENQDNFYLDGRFMRTKDRDDAYSFVESAKTPQLYGVFDGLGGEIGGAISSEIACKTLNEFREKILNSTTEDLYDTFCAYATLANDRICKELNSTYYSKGGTTFVSVLIRDQKIYPFYLGDSRIYLGYEDSMYQLTEDHTVAMERVKNGEKTIEEAEKSPEHHMLTHFLGDNPITDYEQVAACPTVKALDRMWVLLCSDGLHDMVPPAVIKMLIETSEDPAKALVQEALKNGGFDNVTPVVLRFTKL